MDKAEFLVRYKGFEGPVSYNKQDNIFHGGTVLLEPEKEYICYEGTYPDDVAADFKEAVEDHLKYCKKKKEEDLLVSSSKGVW